MTDTLFNTNALFSLSGNQPYQPHKMAIPEKKESLNLDVKKLDVDKLYGLRNCGLLK